jgi:hypothetical protein
MRLGASWLAISACVCCALFASCSQRTQEVVLAEQRGTLEQGEAARVGDEVVTVEQVRALSKAANLSLEEARSKLVFDALMAIGARDRGYDRHDDVIIRRRALLVRALLEKMKRDADARPLTDEEVGRYTELHWLDLDRPVARRTTHAVVMPKDPENEAEATKADEIAKRIAEAVRSATDAKAFKKKAEAVDAGGMKVVVQNLPPIADDGRVADLDNRPPPEAPTRTFAEQYVKAVFGIAEVGGMTKPFRSPFGTHVAMLVSIQPALRVPAEKRRKMLSQEIRTGRVKKELDALKKALSEKTPPNVERNANSLLQLVSQEPAERGL